MKIETKKINFVSTTFKTLVLFVGLLSITLPAEGQSFGDFNNDGFDDLAVGVPFEDIGNISSAGAVNIIYGSAGGLTPAGNQIFHQNSPGILGTAEAYDHFGWALTIGDFNNDGFDDLAVSVPSEDIGNIIDAGAVNIIYGSAGGLTPAGNQLFHQNSPGILGAAEAFDIFGRALTTGNFNNDGFDDLAVGVPNEDIGNISNAGAVNIIYGSTGGLTPAGNQLFHQNSPGILGAAEFNDNFGEALTTGRFNVGGFDDLAVGVPKEDIGTIEDAGAVNIIYGSTGGLTPAGNQIFHQNSTGILGTAEAFDKFGWALTTGRLNVGGFDDLAVGVPWEDIGTIKDAGAVNIIYGSTGGLTSAGNQMFHQNSPGILGTAEAIDHFGRALTIGNFNNDGFDDLAVGVPFEDIGTIKGAGAVNVIYGLGGGLSPAGNQMFHQNSPGILGAAEAIDYFGLALTIGNFNNDGFDDLAVGVPFEHIGTIEDAGAVNVIYGLGGGLTPAGNQIFHQNSPGILGAAEAYNYFGRALSEQETQ